MGRIRPLALAVTFAAVGGGLMTPKDAAADDAPSAVTAPDTPPPATATVIVAGPNGQEAIDVPIGESEALMAPSEPPDPLYEEATDEPGPAFHWIRGFWGWTGTDWTWYPAEWLIPPPGLFYVEPYYERVGASVVFVPGYWAPRDAPIRYYGGERIRFREAMRPADYRRGEIPSNRHSMGSQPGSRGAGFYLHSSGSGRARPLPTATAPRMTSWARAGGSSRGEPNGASRGEPGGSMRGGPGAGGGAPRGGAPGPGEPRGPSRGPEPGAGGGRAVGPESANGHLLPQSTPRPAAAPHPQGPPPQHAPTQPQQQHPQQAKKK